MYTTEQKIKDCKKLIKELKGKSKGPFIQLFICNIVSPYYKYGTKFTKRFSKFIKSEILKIDDEYKQFYYTTQPYKRYISIKSVMNEGSSVGVWKYDNLKDRLEFLNFVIDQLKLKL